MTHTIAFIIIAPLFFAIMAFVFKEVASFIGVIFASLWLGLCTVLFLQSLDASVSYSFAGLNAPLGIEFMASSVNSSILMASSFIVFMSTWYAFLYLKKTKHQLFFALSAFLCSGLGILFLSNDIFNLYVGLEMVGLSAVSLSALSANKKSIAASMHYFFATLMASGIYLFAVVLLYIQYSTLHLQTLALEVVDNTITMVAFICIVLALIIKTALFPFHSWLIQAHSNALTPVSALLSAVVIKSSFYLLYQMSFSIFSFETTILYMIGYLGVFAIFYGGFHAFFATQLKVLIAYSTISQVGYLLMLFAFHSNTLAMHASLFMVFSHMFAKAGLFLIAGVLIASSQSKRISELKGIGYIKPLAVFTIALSAISLIGFPPTLGFSGKWYYLQAALQNQQWFLLIAILLSTFITAAYFFKLIILTLQPISKNKHFMTLPHAFSLQLIAFILSLCSLIFGLFSSSILAMLQGV